MTVKQNDVLDRILVRTAQHNKDFTGETNNFVELENFKFKLECLLA